MCLRSEKLTRILSFPLKTEETVAINFSRSRREDLIWTRNLKTLIISFPILPQSHAWLQIFETHIQKKNNKNKNQVFEAITQAHCMHNTRNILFNKELYYWPDPSCATSNKSSLVFKRPSWIPYFFYSRGCCNSKRWDSGDWPFRMGIWVKDDGCFFWRFLNPPQCPSCRVWKLCFLWASD